MAAERVNLDQCQNRLRGGCDLDTHPMDAGAPRARVTRFVLLTVCFPITRTESTYRFKGNVQLIKGVPAPGEGGRSDVNAKPFNTRTVRVG